MSWIFAFNYLQFIRESERGGRALSSRELIYERQKYNNSNLEWYLGLCISCFSLRLSNPSQRQAYKQLNGPATLAMAT